MAFDLSSVLSAATEVTNNAQSNEGGSGNLPRLIYPGPGTLKVKILYNPKSNVVSRSIRRHTVGDSKYACLSMYGMECPICKTIESIKNSTGVDVWKHNAKFRGLTYAQYVGSEGYQWGADGEPQVGELVLLMYPWTVYQDINRIISTAGPNAAQIIASNTGKVLRIIRWTENSQIKYKAELDAFGDFTSFTGDDGESKFENFLNEIHNLNEAILPITPDDKIIAGAREASEVLSREYLRGVSQVAPTANLAQTSQIVTTPDGQQYINVNGQLMPVNNTPNIINPSVPSQVVSNPAPQPLPNVVPQNVAQPQVMPTNIAQGTPTPVITAPQSNPEVPFNNSTPVGMNPPTDASGNAMPECFGQHKDGDPKCMCCIKEMECMTMQQ